MPKFTKQNKPKKSGGRPPDGVKRIDARPMGARSSSTKGGK